MTQSQTWKLPTLWPLPDLTGGYGSSGQRTAETLYERIKSSNAGNHQHMKLVWEDASGEMRHIGLFLTIFSRTVLLYPSALLPLLTFLISSFLLIGSNAISPLEASQVWPLSSQFRQ